MGATTARRAPQEGPRPFLSVLPTARAAVPAPRGSCNSQKQTPKEELPWRPWETAGPAPSGGSGAYGQGLGGHYVTALLPRGGGARWLPCPLPRWWEAKPPGRGEHSPVGWGGGRKVAPASSCPHPPAWAAGQVAEAPGPAESPPYSPSFWEKIFSKVTSPRSSRYFCMTLRMLKDTGAGVTWSPQGSRQACWPCFPGRSLLPLPESRVEGTAGGCHHSLQEGSHPCWT